MLVDEKTNNVVIHIGSNEITKFNTITLMQLAHGIINIDLKCRSYRVNNIAISSNISGKKYFKTFMWRK